MQSDMSLRILLGFFRDTGYRQFPVLRSVVDSEITEVAEAYDLDELMKRSACVVRVSSTIDGGLRLRVSCNLPI